MTNSYNFKPINGKQLVAGITISGTTTNCYNIGNITTGDWPVGGIVATGGTVKSCYNTGDIIGDRDSYLGEITGVNSVNNTNYYLIKTNEMGNSLNANANGAVGKTQAEMDEIMSVENFVNLMNSYVQENNADSSKTKLKTWKLENGFPVFAE